MKKLSYALIFDIFIIILSSFLLLCAATALGEFAFKLFGSQNAPSTVLSTVIGFAVLNSVTELTHIFFPINFVVSTIIFFISISLFYFQNCSQKIKYELSKFKEDRCIIKNNINYFITICAIPFFVIKSMDQPALVDTGLYHLQTILWTNESSVVIGLGNLHNRLAFNHSWHTLSSLMNFHPIFDRGFISLAIAVMILTFYLIFTLNRYKHSNLVTILLIIAVFVDLRHISSPSADLGVTLMQVIIVSLFYNLIFEKQLSLEMQQNKVITILISCTLVLSIKLSSILFSIMTIGIVIISYRNKFTKSKLIMLVLFCILLFLPHLIKGYLLSGAPFFPLKFGRLDGVFWSIPIREINEINYWINCWAKTGGLEACPANLFDFGWTMSWFYGLPLFYKINFLFGSILLLGSIIKIKDHISNYILRNLLMLNTCILLLFAMWIVKGPDPRFLGATSTIYLANSCLIFLIIYLQNIKSYIRFGHFIYKSLSVILFAIILTSFFWNFSLDDLSNILSKGFLPVKNVSTTPFDTVNGKIINIPVGGESCYGSQVPCSKHFRNNIIFGEQNGYLYFAYD